MEDPNSTRRYPDPKVWVVLFFLPDTDPKIWHTNPPPFMPHELGAKKFGMSLETRETKLLWREIPGSCWDVAGVPEKFDKNLCSIFGPCCRSFPQEDAQRIAIWKSFGGGWVGGRH